MIKNEILKIDNFYKFYLLSVVPKPPAIMGKLTGKTTMDSSQYFSEDFNIPSKYLDEYGMSMRDFYEYFTDETEILIIHPLNSLNSLELSDEIIYVPISIIDYTKSEDLLITKSFSFNISGINRYFENDSSLMKYIQNSTIELRKFLNNSSNFNSNTLQINQTNVDLIKTRSEILKDEDIRNKSLSDIKTAIINNNKLLENQIAEYTKKRLEYEEAYKKFNEDTADIENMKQEWVEKYNQIDELNSIMDKKDENLRKIYDKLKSYADDMGVEMPPYDQL